MRMHRWRAGKDDVDAQSVGLLLPVLHTGGVFDNGKMERTTIKASNPTQG